MIRKLKFEEQDAVRKILVSTNNFTEAEIETAMELVDVYMNVKGQKDYEIFVDAENSTVNGYVCIGQRPLTKGTYDLYWIAVNPEIQSKGVGSHLIEFIENHIREKNGNLVLIETSGKPSYEKERKFYEKNNYTKFVEIKDFYDVNDSLVIYGKYI